MFARQIILDPPCSTCSVRVERIATLGSDDGLGALGSYPEAARDREGNFLVSYFENRSQFLVFDSTGSFIRSVGRQGAGPGEYRFVRHISATERAVYIWDSTGRRITELLAGDSAARTFPILGDPLSVAVIDDSTFVYNAVVTTSDLIGKPFHVLHAGAARPLSFGDEGEAFRPDVGFAGRRAVDRADATSFWAGLSTEYRLQRWSLDGVRLGEWVRNVDWFPRHYTEPLPDPERPPAPYIVDIAGLTNGRVVVLIAVPDPRWREGIVPSPVPEGTGYQIGDANRYFDTMIELIDPERAVVLGSTRVDAFLVSMLDASTALSYRETEAGFPRADVWRFHFH